MGAPKGNQYAKGNPGPTRHKPVTQQMIAELNELVDEIEVVEKTVRGKKRMVAQPSGKQITRMRKMVRAIISCAEQGDVSAFNAIMDRVEGKAAQGVIVAEAGSPEADAMLAMPDSFKDLPMSELVRLHQDMVAGRIRPNDNTPQAPEPAKEDAA